MTKFYNEIKIVKCIKTKYIHNMCDTILKKKKKKGSVWYMCLKTENYYLKIFIKIHVGKKVYENT